jgi:hypothetical protein
MAIDNSSVSAAKCVNVTIFWLKSGSWSRDRNLNWATDPPGIGRIKIQYIRGNSVERSMTLPNTEAL